jgi:hypothetical protein
LSSLCIPHVGLGDDEAQSIDEEPKGLVLVVHEKAANHKRMVMVSSLSWDRHSLCRLQLALLRPGGLGRIGQVLGDLPRA